MIFEKMYRYKKNNGTSLIFSCLQEGDIVRVVTQAFENRLYKVVRISDGFSEWVYAEAFSYFFFPLKVDNSHVV